LGKIKARFHIYSIYWKVSYQHCWTVWQLFFSKTVAAHSSKPFSVADVTEFSTEAKDTCTCVDQKCSGNFCRWQSSAGHLSLIFAGNDPSFTDESGKVELRQLDATGVDTAKIHYWN